MLTQLRPNFPVQTGDWKRDLHEFRAAQERWIDRLNEPGALAIRFDDLNATRNVINARDWGAKGDGVTDDTAAINAAFAEINIRSDKILLDFPPGNYKITSKLTVPAGCHILGRGQAKTKFTSTVKGDKTFSIAGTDTHLGGFTLVYAGSGAANAGTFGIYTSGGNVTVGGANKVHIHEVEVQSFYDGIVIDGSLGSVDLSNVISVACEHDGIAGKSAQGVWTNIIVTNHGGNGVTLTASSPASGICPFIVGFHSYANAGWDFWTDNGVLLLNAFGNGSKLGCFYSGTTGVDAGYVTSSNWQFAGDHPTLSDNTSAPAIKLDTGSGPVLFTDLHIYNPQGNAIEADSDNHIFNGGRILGAGQGAQAGKNYGLLATGAGIAFRGVFTNSIIKISGSVGQVTGNTISCNNASAPACYFSAGTAHIFGDNYVANAGGGAALQADAATSIALGQNVYATGAVTISGTRLGSTGTGTTFVMSTSPTLVTPVLGAASASSLNLTGSSAPANGPYLPAANTLGWGINSNELMRLTANGLGVGRSPVASDMGVAVQSSGTTARYRIGNSSNANAADFVSVATDTYLYNLLNGNLFLGTNNATVITLNGTGTTFAGKAVSTSATGGVGYATGAGGTQTQLTSKSTTVVLNAVCGEITMHNATLNANTTVSFTLTNSAVAATDNLLCVHASGGTVGSYMIHGRGTGAGSATITVRNITAGNLGEAIVIRFTVLKGVTS